MEPNISSQPQTPEVKNPIKQPVSSTPANPSSKTKYILIAVLVLLVLFAVGGAYYLGIKNQSSQNNNQITATIKPSPTLTPVPTIQPSPTSSLNLTTNWKTYTFPNSNVSFLYPPTWSLNSYRTIDATNPNFPYSSQIIDVTSNTKYNDQPFELQFEYYSKLATLHPALNCVACPVDNILKTETINGALVKLVRLKDPDSHLSLTQDNVVAGASGFQTGIVTSGGTLVVTGDYGYGLKGNTPTGDTLIQLPEYKTAVQIIESLRFIK